MSDWLTGLSLALGQGQVGIVVSVVATQGSTPREPGARMTVTPTGCFGTIGGGNLEYQATGLARELLAAGGGDGVCERRLILGPSLGQCCGGAVVLRFERVATCEQLDALALLRQPIDFDITLFGAGHVGKALVQVLQGLPCTITWIDSRPEQFPPVSSLAANVRIEISDAPELDVDDLPPGGYVLIMTHSHPLDQAICERALRRTDLRYCGLIGSQTKLRQFRQRLLRRGLDRADLVRLICPIGIDGISGKHPGEIAVAVAAQLLQLRERAGLADRSVSSEEKL